MMSLKKMKQLLATVEAFNVRVAQFDAIGKQLMAEQEALVVSIREKGLLKNEAEAMVAKVKCDVQLPEAEADGEDDAPAGGEELVQQDDAA